MNGGDFRYTFDNGTQDSNYNVIPELQEAVKTYNPSIVEVGGDATFVVEEPPTESEYRIVHNVTTQGTQSDFYKISSTVSNLFGSMRYDATNLTHALKFEGSSSIEFTPEHNGNMTIVANSYKGAAKVKVNGADVNGDSNTGIITFPVIAGTPYAITRSSTAYLYYLVLEYDQFDPSASADPNVTPKPTAAPASTPEPTATPEPTTTPTPMTTPEPPGMPEPTGIPDPTVTPEPTAMPELQYLYEIQEFEFDADGKLNLSLTYNGQGGDKASLLIASYADNGILTGVKIFNIYEDKIEDLDFSTPSSGKIRFFVWNFTELKPLSESKMFP